MTKQEYKKLIYLRDNTDEVQHPYCIELRTSIVKCNTCVLSKTSYCPVDRQSYPSKVIKDYIRDILND